MVSGYDMAVKGYPGIWAASYPSMLMYGASDADSDRLAFWQERMTALLDAAGVTDTATRTFFLTRHHAGEYACWMRLRNTPPVRAEVLWALRQMLPLFTCCVYGSGGGALTNVEHLCVIHPAGTPFADTIAAFNALSTWGAAPTGIGYNEFARHVGAMDGAANDFSEYDLSENIIIRSRGDATFMHPLHCAATVETSVSLGNVWQNGFSLPYRPYFQTQDWPGITGVGTGINPPNDAVLAALGSASVAADDFSTTLKVGDWTGYNLDNGTYPDNLILAGWYASPSYQRWDFAVPGGFVFV